MVLNKKYKYAPTFLFMVMHMFMCLHMNTQDLEYSPELNDAATATEVNPPDASEAENNTETRTTLWSDEQWQKAKEGIEYTKPEEAKEKEEEEEEEEEKELNSKDSWNISEWLTAIFTSPTGKLIAILVIIGLLVFLLIRLIVNRTSDKKVSDIPTDVYIWQNEEDIPEETDMERHLREALESGNYKIAVRILYLIVIRQLHENKIIIWKKDKTNRDYLNEMRQRSDYKNFREVTHIYEVVWYGDFDINVTEFEKIQSVFSSYKNRINGNTEKI